METIEVRRRVAIWVIVGVCGLSAAIGSGVALLARTGPAGTRGEQGPAGPRGPKGTVDTGAIEGEIEALRGETNTVELEEDVLENEGRVEELEHRLHSAERTTSELCGAIEFFC
ncbi:MAG: hypothetical protein ACHQCF_07645 [Solirubrobacterales bacterium]